MSAAHQVLHCQGRSVQVGALLPDPIPREGHLSRRHDHDRPTGTAMKKRKREDTAPSKSRAYLAYLEARGDRES